MKIHESAENYLEAILVLGQKKSEVRSIDVANYMNFSKPSVSVAMKQLRQNGYIQMDENGFLTLLPPGREIAEMIYERHCIIAKILIALGVDEETAFADACKIEHVVSPQSFACMKAHYDRFSSSDPA